MNHQANTNDLYIWIQPFHTLQNCCNRGGNTVFKCIFKIFVALSTSFHLCCHSLEVPYSLLKKRVSKYFCPYYECTSHWCLFGDEFLAQGLHLKSHQRCSAGIMTWLSADQSSSSTLTESSFLFDPCLLHRDTVMLEYKGFCPNCCYKIRSTQFPRISLYA